MMTNDGVQARIAELQKEQMKVQGSRLLGRDRVKQRVEELEKEIRERNFVTVVVERDAPKRNGQGKAGAARSAAVVREKMSNRHSLQRPAS